MTSPPYWGLRCYGIAPSVWGGDPACRHVWGGERKITKSGGTANSTLHLYANGLTPETAAVQIERSMLKTSSQGAFCRRCGAWRGAHGLEPTIDLYVRNAVEIFRAVHRVLRSDGTLWLNLGDSYSSGGRSSRDTSSENKGNTGALQPFRGDDGLKPKDLCGIPWRIAFALQADGWWLRQDIVWHKKNPMPESVTDRCTKSHEYIFLLTKSARYFFDAEAIREAHQDQKGTDRFVNGCGVGERKENQGWAGGKVVLDQHREYNPAGRNKRSVWTVATSPFPEAHFATFPPKLIEPCIKAGTSERGVCDNTIMKLRLRSDLTDEQRARVYARLGSRGIA